MRLSPLSHGVLDYMLAPLMLFAPEAIGLDGRAEALARVSGAGYLAASMLTAYPLGVWRVFPLPCLGILKVLAAVFWAATPWLFGVAMEPAARNFFLAAAAIALAMAALTDYGSERTYLWERRQPTRDRRARHGRIKPDRRVGRVDRRAARYFPAHD